MKEAAKNASKATASSAPAGKAAAKVEVQEEKKEEEADVDMGGMFGDEYWWNLERRQDLKIGEVWKLSSYLYLCFSNKLETDIYIYFFSFSSM